jgi:heme exporter protein D
MHWNSLQEFLAMGGYGLYVWGSYGATAILMIAEPLLARHRLSETRRSLKRERLADELEQESK